MYGGITSNASEPSKTMVIIGDVGSGRNSVMRRFRYGITPGPGTVAWLVDMDPFSTQIEVFGRRVSLRCCRPDDSIYSLQAGFCGKGPIAILGNSQVDAIVLTFDIGRLNSFRRAEFYWGKMLAIYCSHIPLILLGCKADKRQHNADCASDSRTEGHEDEIITKDEAISLMKRLGAETYLECSALTGNGIHELFLHAARVTHRSQRGKAKSSMK
ncbi:Rho GTPase [Serendipita sp. 411]|nr:Rho GTPase [Serendipita sp. 400]KAG8849587.1 Rho GTPase [Serendipita sp. 411]